MTLGWTAVHEAARHGHAGCLAILLKHGAELVRPSAAGTNALMLAAAGGSCPCAELVLDSGGALDQACEAAAAAAKGAMQLALAVGKMADAMGRKQAEWRPLLQVTALPLMAHSCTRLIQSLINHLTIAPQHHHCAAAAVASGGGVSQPGRSRDGRSRPAAEDGRPGSQGQPDGAAADGALRRRLRAGTGRSEGQGTVCDRSLRLSLCVLRVVKAHCRIAIPMAAKALTPPGCGTTTGQERPAGPDLRRGLRRLAVCVTHTVSRAGQCTRPPWPPQSCIKSCRQSAELSCRPRRKVSADARAAAHVEGLAGYEAAAAAAKEASDCAEGRLGQLHDRMRAQQAELRLGW